MHTLMSFVGCAGVLTANSGLKDILKTSFCGVTRMLTGKNFSQNVRALRMVAEEVLRKESPYANTLDDLMLSS
ncbi:hypothetical protein DPMN_031739 [Dreissena polymorpha]|uniref:Uncharacterized protein n=1 Tax=Dreissena polymorpha TaxID=45954 RepID=A0A9D4RHL2_DREPO|nr:hypothetical protein DPMN_031739 [Dreissena polymorpha]